MYQKCNQEKQIKEMAENKRNNQKGQQETICKNIEIEYRRVMHYKSDKVQKGERSKEHDDITDEKNKQMRKTC